jgi:hypothetical protein
MYHDSDEQGTCRWTVGLLRPIHQAMVGAWLAAERPAPPREEPSDPTLLGEVVAAACERIAREEPSEGLRVPAVRTVTLLALLERRFGCEVGRGKGSEVTVWRPGGRKFTLGHHRRNTHVPAHVVRALLKAVGIGAVEWAAGTA